MTYDGQQERNIGGPCCAHTRVSWRTKEIEGGLTTGWWECDSGCGMRFTTVPHAEAIRAEAAQASPAGSEGIAPRLRIWRETIDREARPSVLGAGNGLPIIPTRSEAEAVWRRLYVERMVERGIDRASAQACCDAGDVDLSVDPADAADDELQYWSDDGEDA